MTEVKLFMSFSRLYDEVPVFSSVSNFKKLLLTVEGIAFRFYWMTY